MAGLTGTSYADKLRRVRHLGDSLLEEDNGDTTSMMASIYSDRQPSRNVPHPVKAAPGETLPEGFSRNYAGFLLRDMKREIKVDQNVVKEEMEFYSQFVVIANFIGGKPNEQALHQWLVPLQSQVKGALSLGRQLGRGFFSIKTASADVVRNLLLLTPYHSPYGLCIFQRWIPSFDPSADFGSRSLDGHMLGMKIPTWVTLRHLPDEFRGVANQIAAGLGELLGEDLHNNDHSDPRFCVALNSGLGWEPSVLVNNDYT